MTEEVLHLDSIRKNAFLDKVKELVPAGALDMCLTCGMCSSGCPASGLEDMDPRKFLRMAVLGLDDELKATKWAWMCSMCTRCIEVCPMKIDIPQLTFYLRQSWPREKRPKGILSSCDMALNNPCCSAMGTQPEDFRYVVEDVLAEYQEAQPEFGDLEAPIDKESAHFYLSQNSREPMTEPDEMVPLWKILHTVGADWTYGSIGWAGENYCLFLADDDAWKHIDEAKAGQAEKLGVKVYLNTE